MLQPKGYVWLLLLMFANIGAVNATETGAYFISAKSGMINYVEGKPTVSKSRTLRCKAGSCPGSNSSRGMCCRRGRTSGWKCCSTRGPTCGWRKNSRVRVVATAFDDMRFSLEKGTAILESLSLRRKVHRLLIVTPSGDLGVLKKGFVSL